MGLVLLAGDAVAAVGADVGDVGGIAVARGVEVGIHIARSLRPLGTDAGDVDVPAEGNAVPRRAPIKIAQAVVLLQRPGGIGGLQSAEAALIGAGAAAAVGLAAPVERRAGHIGAAEPLVGIGARIVADAVAAAGVGQHRFDVRPRSFELGAELEAPAAAGRNIAAVFGVVAVEHALVRRIHQRGAQRVFFVRTVQAFHHPGFGAAPAVLPALEIAVVFGDFRLLAAVGQQHRAAAAQRLVERQAVGMLDEFGLHIVARVGRFKLFFALVAA